MKNNKMIILGWSIPLSICYCAKVELLQVLTVRLKYLAFKDRFSSKIMRSSSIVTLKHMFGLIFRSVLCTQVLQIK